MVSSYRTVWLSDVHLGTKASRARDLLHFLNSVDADRIYLVGDIIDLERMKSRPRFPETHRQVVSRIIELASSGTDVIYIPGNHDVEFRNVVGKVFFGIPVLLEAEHKTPTGQRLLITHGDVLDGRIRQGTNLQKFGAAAYKLLMEFDVLVNRMRLLLGHEYFSISASIKRRLSGANEYIRRFEIVAAEYALERGFDGIVCGHIHRPCVRMIKGCLYANDGDWVEHGTALAERPDGTLEVLEMHTGSPFVADVFALSETMAAA
ncbi:MAG: UDP-2,3-diacylglucosamine diphosphatase [Pseudomonadota bacterium]